MTNVAEDRSDSLDRQTDEMLKPQHAPYLLFILVISVLALPVLAANMFVDSESEAGRILQLADTLLCMLFFGDFLVCLWRAKSKGRYMLTWGWLDLLSSIPAVDALRWGRAARFVRLLRVFRGVRSARILMQFILERRAQSVGLAAVLSSIVVIVVSSMAILHLEAVAGPSANIRTAEDAIWWSTSTITTVGYGDHYPVTTEGRCVAVALMMAGIVLLGTWAGIATSWFLSAADEKQDENILTLQLEIQELRRLLKSTPRMKPRYVIRRLSRPR